LDAAAIAHPAGRRCWVVWSFSRSPSALIEMSATSF
jgi:hypothetical protein